MTKGKNRRRFGVRDTRDVKEIGTEEGNTETRTENKKRVERKCHFVMVKDLRKDFVRPWQPLGLVEKVDPHREELGVCVIVSTRFRNPLYVPYFFRKHFRPPVPSNRRGKRKWVRVHLEVNFRLEGFTLAF